MAGTDLKKQALELKNNHAALSYISVTYYFSGDLAPQGDPQVRWHSTISLYWLSLS